MYLTNQTIEKLKNNQSTLGMFLLAASPFITETCATMPLDWLVMDIEASPVNRKDLLDFVLALKGEKTTPFARIRHIEHAHIEQVLDLGVQGIIVPKVNNREDAIRVVSACRYPPQGKRGINPVRASRYFEDVAGYLEKANDLLLCFLQIETQESLKNLEEIAAVDGVDGLFVGCGDLAMALGQPGDVIGFKMKEAINQVLETCQKYSKIPGIFAYGTNLAKLYLEQGYRFVAIGNDIKAVKEGIESWLKVIKQNN